MLLVVDKPSGITSFDVIYRIRRHFPKGTKVGHAGTLDPLATGLMLVGTHQNTKTLTGLTKLDKTYEVTIDLSQRSDTWDTEYRDWSEYVSDEEWNRSLLDPKTKTSQEQQKLIENTLKVLIPYTTLPLPHFSAKKKNGQKLYDLARKGKHVNEAREMKIHSIHIISRESPLVKLRINVGSGTYIRSIAYRLGQQLKT
jgi:tRNA pseudouridine55 synthase